MTDLVGEFSSAAFIEANDVYPNGDGEFYSTYTAATSGVAEAFHFYVSDWWTSASAKLRLRNSSGDLLDEVTLTSAAGTGLIEGVLSGGANIVAGEDYILGFICNTGNIQPFNDNVNSVLERQSASTYTTAQDPLVAGSTIAKGQVQMYISGTEATSSATVTTSATNEEGSTITFTHSGLSGPVVSATLTDSGGNVLNLTNVVDNLDGTGTADIPAFNTAGQQACLFGEVTLTIASATTERYLQFDGVDDSAAFDSAISLGVDEYLELDFLYEDTGGEYQNLFEVYLTGGNDFFLIRDSNRIQLRLNPTAYDGTFVPVDGERYVIRLERTATQYEIFVNDVSDFVVPSAADMGPIYGFSDSDADRLGGKVYGATRGVIGGALINNWSTADSSGGTFTDIIGGNNATLVGYPLDESMWVDEVIS